MESGGSQEGRWEDSTRSSFLSLSRFYKLHERKCEPIVMTVPRKVRPPHSPVHPLPPLANRPLRGDQGEACEWNMAEYGYSQ